MQKNTNISLIGRTCCSTLHDDQKNRPSKNLQAEIGIPRFRNSDERGEIMTCANNSRLTV